MSADGRSKRFVLKSLCTSQLGTPGLGAHGLGTPGLGTPGLGTPVWVPLELLRYERLSSNCCQANALPNTLSLERDQQS